MRAGGDSAARAGSAPHARAGVGFKPQHRGDLQAGDGDGLWLEIHAENLMMAGAPALRELDALRARHDISLHGVGVSLGSADGLDAEHLARLSAVAARCQPMLVSEHLAWSRQGGTFLPDLLPLPCDAATLRLVAAHVDRIQAVLGRRILIENPSAYFAWSDGPIAEPDFLRELARRTGCGLLLDINNVVVSAHNLGFDPRAYLAAFPVADVGEIHLAGHAIIPDPAGGTLRVDTHDRPVAPEVWALYLETIDRAGPVPTLIERDAAIPPFAALRAEAAHAAAILSRVCGGYRAHAA